VENEFFFEPSSKRRKGYPSETKVKRGFPRRPHPQRALRETGQEWSLSVRLRPQISRSAVCQRGITTAYGV